MRFRGPLADSYPAAAALVIFALVPYLALTSALTPLQQLLGKGVGLSPQSLELTTGMANAAYAFGTVIAVQFALHLPARRMLVAYASLFALASVLAALAPTPGVFIAARILQGGCTSLMLIAAVPPLVTGWPVSKMPVTAVVMNLCVFGAVAVGPVIGGVQASSLDWRPLFWAVAGLGGLALLFALLTYEDVGPLDRDAPWDWVAVILAGGGCAAAFFGASELVQHSMTSVIVLVPLLLGVGMIAGLVVHQYAVKRALMPVRGLTTTIPLAAVIVVMGAGAASVAVIELVQTALKSSGSPGHIAMLFWPEFGGALLSAIIFGRLFRTKVVVLLPLAGMALLAGGAAVLTGVSSGPHTLVAVGSGLVGLGVGGSVSPALFLAGFSLPSAALQRVFALIELLRGVAAFMVAPILLHLAMTVSSKPGGAIATAIWVCFGLAAGCGVLMAYLFAVGGVALRAPDLERWNEGEEPAWESPPLAARIRRDRRRWPAAQDAEADAP